MVAFVASPAAHGASAFDPALRFRTIATEHFVIHFHQGEDRAAQRLAAIAEETWRTLSRPLGTMPPPRTQVVLADQSELANGYATPVPYDTVVIYAVWPSGSEFDFDDWLRLAFTHEFTHIVHLDRSEGWARVARSIFGRTAYAFPNLFLPTWQIEGIASYEESVVTGEGRLHAGDFRAIVDEAARAGRPEPLDRINGGVTDWPAGAAPYAYGVAFHDYLARRFGAASLAALATATARRFPYTSTRAFLYVYGESLGELWRDFEAETTAAARAQPPSSDERGIAQLTHDGFSTSGPRFDRFVCAACPPEILYSVASPDGFPSLNRVTTSGSPARLVTSRYLGSTTAIGRDTLYFDQLEQRRNVGLYSDLYALSRADGRVTQLTFNARLRDPDLSPGGTTIVATQARAGQRDLVAVRLFSTFGPGPRSTRTRSARSAEAVTRRPPLITPVISEPDVYFDRPRWSPDGRSIAVERHRLGAMPEIVVVDVATAAVRVLAADPRTRFVMPTWRPDGAALVAAAAGDQETFNLVEVAADGSAQRQLTHVTGAALWPDVSPDGKTIAFAGYTLGGYDIFTMPYPEARTLAVPIAIPVPPPTAATQSARDVPGTCLAPSCDDGDVSELSGPVAHVYNPLSTLAPTSWSPVIQTDADQARIGAAVGGVDVLGYHTYAVDASWLLASAQSVATASRATPDWSAYYAYARWRPTLYAAASKTTSFFAGPATDRGTPASATRRERTVEAGVILPFIHTRVAHEAVLSVQRSSLEDTLPIGVSTRVRTPLRAGWATATAHTYGYSVSRERGIFAGATAELVRRGVGSAADATTITGDARAYLPGLAPHHVVALRISGGVSSGDLAVGRTFLLGGSASDAGVLDFGSRASSLLRGFADASFAGSRVALANGEYRFPIARPQRGVGTWPVLLHTVHAAVFVDAGNAWTRTFDASAVKLSAGAELAADVVLGYFARVTVAGGAAFGHDGAGVASDRATAYFRVGRSF